MNDPIVIVSAARTPMGSFQGVFGSLSAPQLGAVAIKAAVGRAGIDPSLVEEVVFGCVLPAGVGQAPVRQAALLAGLPLSTSCAMVSKVCGSGMKATMVGHDGILAGSSGVTVVGARCRLRSEPGCGRAARPRPPGRSRPGLCTVSYTHLTLPTNREV